MVGLAVGDLLCPTDKMVLAYSVEELKGKISRVLATDFCNKDRADIRRTWRNVEENGPAAEKPPADLCSLIAEADLLAIQICPISAATLMAAPRLKAIATARGGLENIDMKKATELGIAVINTPNHNSQAVAEYTIGLMLAETRNISRSYMALKSAAGWREYYPNTDFIPELNGSTIGLVGFGQTGRLVARRLSSFDVKILVYDPFVDPAALVKAGYAPVGLPELLKESDIVSLHARLTDATKGMIGEKGRPAGILPGAEGALDHRRRGGRFRGGAGHGGPSPVPAGQCHRDKSPRGGHPQLVLGRADPHGHAVRKAAARGKA
ncbi:MAG: NAD(P)-dependent oxidoreductase [Spirochaetia bacterium]